MSAQGRMLVHPDIKSENQPERAAHFLDVPNMPWEATKFPGIKIKVLGLTIVMSTGLFVAILISILFHAIVGFYLWKAKFHAQYRSYEDEKTNAQGTATVELLPTDTLALTAAGPSASGLGQQSSVEITLQQA